MQAEEPEPILGLDRLLAPLRVDDGLPTRARHTYALVDGDHVEGRGSGLLVYRDCSAIGTGTDHGTLIASLLISLNRAAVDKCDMFAAHAGVVSNGGVTIALPAASGHGKSTLTAACLRAGFDYVSDEAISVEVSTAEVVPYPKPIGLSEWSRKTLGVEDSALAFPAGPAEGFVTAEQLGASVADGPLGLDHVVIAEYGHEKTELVEAPGSEAMRVLLEMSFNHYKFGVDAFQLAARLANEAQTWRLTYGDPLEAGGLLMERFG